MDDFKRRRDKFRHDEELIENYDEKSDKEFILEFDVKHPKKLPELQSDLPLLPEKMKTKKCEKLDHLHNKTNYVIYVKVLKKELNHELVLAKLHSKNKFNQEARMKSKIDMNTRLK